ncbi:acetate--CoA ligase family protein [Geomicrobium sp. JCM 19055]|uniref:acetate--CoA ligase family protein n=1 Tax=Geomicrobium sp. JCM 19055 TaxID=1460649 RepID=UPI00045ED860|nr:acetate--CoA ligase family protein [Geomicrobium sp. JCM 19055]GAJ97759.1 acetyl-CoA synthetase [Geomicrobium sp. JCM 19055]
MSRTEAIERLLHPKSVAIVGVSKDFSSISGKPLKNLLEHHYSGHIYPVNPKYDSIGDLTCYDSVLDIPGEVDVALLAVSASRILSILDECEQKGIRSLILFGSGFAEVGEEGKALQEKVEQKAKQANLSLLGPNCLGLLNVKDSLPLGFATSFETETGFISGNVGFASQSGALGFSLFGIAQEQGIGFSYIINTGNQMDINTIDIMDYLLDDHDTKVVAGYLESIPDGEAFIALAKKAKEIQKPLLIMKAGRSEIGQEAAMSHTASMTGSDEMFQTISKQYGVVIANDVDDLVDLMKIFSRTKSMHGNRVVTISNSGAAGITMADYSEQLGLDLVRLEPKTLEQISSIIPSYGSAVNPIDVTAQALKEQHIIADTLDVLANASEVDAIVVQTTFGGELGKKVCERIVEIDQQTEKPIVVTVTGSEELTGAGRKALEDANVPVYVTSYKTMYAVEKLSTFTTTTLEDIDVQSSLKVSPSEAIWTEVVAKQAVKELGIDVPRGVLVTGDEQLVKVSEELAYPVVAKVISDDILHKSDVGGVELGIENSTQLRESYDRIVQSVAKHHPSASIDGILVEEMMQEKSVEMFIGIQHDVDFGPFIVCGLGGIYIEVFKDYAMRHAPVSKRSAYQMIDELQSAAILKGVRGHQGYDVNALADAIVKLSQFAAANQDRIQEMDLNPVFVREQGLQALDAIIVWREVDRVHS